MNNTDIIGTAGVGLILIGYFCNTFSLIKKEGVLFFSFNVSGAALACLASWLIPFWPFVILEGTWCLVSVIGLLRVLR